MMTDPEANSPAAPSLLRKMQTRWRLCAAIVAGSLAVGVALHFLTPPTWRAVGTILIAQRDSAPGVASAIPGLAQDPIRILAGVLESERAKTNVSEALKIDYEDLSYVVRANPANGQITITKVDENREIAAQIVEKLIEQLGEIETEIGFTEADREARNLKTALEERRKVMADLELQVVAFMRSAKTSPDPDNPLAAQQYVTQLKDLQIQKASLEAQLEALKQNSIKLAQRGAKLPVDSTSDLSAWRRKLDDAVYQLNVLRISEGERSPSVMKAKETVRVAEAELQKQAARALQAANEGVDAQYLDVLARKVVVDSQIASLTPLVEKAPDEGLQLQRLRTQLDTAMGAVELAERKYETARLNADASRVKWSVLDQPYVERRPVNKSLFRTGVVFLLIGLALSALAAAWAGRGSKA
ncbi:MAG: hypothetical protein MH204_08950 [Fimbriimonadaceae bacterium]|nr:hypothetical protein [Fimbriimonadaceae bacterium]